ncbi:MAG: hypothetical protein AAB553_00075, partial [Patescibacteria group bacterium]
TFTIVLTALILFFRQQKKIHKYGGLIKFFLAISFISIFLSASISSFFWEIIPSAWIQFPFRLLSYLVITVAFLGAFVASRFAGKFQWMVLSVGFILVLTTAYPYSQPKEYVVREEGFYTTSDATTTVKDEYLPRWVEQKSSARPTEKVVIRTGEGAITDIFSTNKEIRFTVASTRDARTHVQTIYWPGWQATIDGKQTVIRYNNPQGIIELSIPEGKHTVSITFGETPLRLMADGISILSSFVLCYLSFSRRRESRKK